MGEDFLKKVGMLALAEMTAVTVLAPLERCKLLLQTQALVKVPLITRQYSAMFYMREIPRREGYRSFWRGNLCSLWKVLVSTGLRYPVLPLLSPALPTQLLFGVATLALVYPLDLARTRLAVQVVRKRETPIYRGLVDTLQKTFADEGVKGMFKGCGVASGSLCGLLLLENLLSKPVHRRLKPYSGDMLEEQIRVHSVSMMLSQFLLYPLDTVRRTMQVSGSRTHEQVSGFSECCRRIYAAAGVKGFYRGCAVHLLRLPPTLTIFYSLSDFARIRYDWFPRSGSAPSYAWLSEQLSIWTFERIYLDVY